MSKALAQILAENGIYYGDPFIVKYAYDESGHDMGEVLGHEVIRRSNDHPRVMYDFFCFYNSSHPITGKPQYNDTLQLYDINRSNLMQTCEITREPVWAPTPLDERLVQEYLDRVESGIISGEFEVDLIASNRSAGLIIDFIRLLGSVFSENRDRNGDPIDL